MSDRTARHQPDRAVGNELDAMALYPRLAVNDEHVIRQSMRPGTSDEDVMRQWTRPAKSDEDGMRQRMPSAAA